MDKWIAVSERLPTEAEALRTDATGCVRVWNVHNGEQIAGWHQVRAGGVYSHWMPCDMPPEGIENVRPEYLRLRIGRDE